MKKVFIWLAVVSLIAVFSIVGCKAEEVSEEAEAVEEAVEEVVASEGDDVYTFAFVPGILDPFYINLQKGFEYAAESMGIETITQIPEAWDPAVQTPIIDVLMTRGDIDLLITAPTDKEGMIEVLKRVDDSDVPVITVDTYIGDGVYEEGHPAAFPISYIGSKNTEGGAMCADALAEAIGYKGKVYAQATTPGVSTGDQRILGFEQGISAYPDIEYIGLDYNDDDISSSTSQTTAVLEREPDLAGIFANNTMGGAGAGLAVQNAGLEGEVKVICFDATQEAAENLEKGVISMALAQKPFDMGLFAVIAGYAYLEGVEQIPIRIPTGYVVITKDSMNDPEISKWIYQE